MRKIAEINKMIDEQIECLKSKGMEPKYLLLGDFSYYTLKLENKDKLIKTSNNGWFLKDYKGLVVLMMPVYESGGFYVPEEQDKVEVLATC